jgi:lactate dehydrogenase-like 2-hydroxyacid dehydrogenase
MPDRATTSGQQSRPVSEQGQSASQQSQPVVVITPGAGAAAVAEGAIGMALHLVKRFGPLTALVRDGRCAATFTAAAQGILDVPDGREPRAVANPGWRTGRPADSKEISV